MTYLSNENYNPNLFDHTNNLVSETEQHLKNLIRYAEMDVENYHVNDDSIALRDSKARLKFLRQALSNIKPCYKK